MGLWVELVEVVEEVSSASSCEYARPHFVLGCADGSWAPLALGVQFVKCEWASNVGLYFAWGGVL